MEQGDDVRASTPGTSRSNQDLKGPGDATGPGEGAVADGSEHLSSIVTCGSRIANSRPESRIRQRCAAVVTRKTDLPKIGKVPTKDPTAVHVSIV